MECPVCKWKPENRWEHFDEYDLDGSRLEEMSRGRPSEVKASVEICVCPKCHIIFEKY